MGYAFLVALPSMAGDGVDVPSISRYVCTTVQDMAANCQNIPELGLKWLV